tara:strand:+ start:414 stop:677 length:264 start_codon:yes stop_codon:yes gene_type:complete
MIKLKKLLKEDELKKWPEIRKGDYVKDVYKMGQFDVVIKTEKFKGEYLVVINPKGSNKAIVGVSYDATKFVDSGKKKSGKTIWIVGK